MWRKLHHDSCRVPFMSHPEPLSFSCFIVYFFMSKINDDADHRVLYSWHMSVILHVMQHMPILLCVVSLGVSTIVDEYSKHFVLLDQNNIGQTTSASQRITIYSHDLAM